MIRNVSKILHRQQLKQLINCQSRFASTKEPKDTQSFIVSAFRGNLETSLVFPYPNPSDEEKETSAALSEPLLKFYRDINNADTNDKLGKVEDATVEALWELGGFSMQVSPEYGGLGLTNTQYAGTAEIAGANDLALSILLGAHQSIGFKGITLFGTPEQKQKYLTRVSTGKQFAAFCLTEPLAGSDAASVRTRAELSPDGKHYILNGSKIWISNGGFAEIFTVFAKTPIKDPVTGEIKEKMTAFIVERAFGGVTSGPPEDKMGIKASNTTELFFDNTKVPVENVLGGLGNGFKVAMNILNNGRFGLVAAMSGTQKFCMSKAIEFATQRKQFGKTIEHYGSIQEKLGRMAALQYVTQSLAFLLAGNMDNGATEYQVESAAAKVFASEAAWWVCDESIQVMGGMGFMRSSQLERFLRDLRIFRIFEGANDILRLFVALNGIQHAGLHLKELQKALKNPAANLGLLLTETGKRAFRTVGLGQTPSMTHLVHPNLMNAAHLCAKSVEHIGVVAEKVLVDHGKNIIDQQFLLTRLGSAAIDTWSMSVVLSRCTRSLNSGLPTAEHEEELTKFWCTEAAARVEANCETVLSQTANESFKTLSKVSKALCQNGGSIALNPLGI